MKKILPFPTQPEPTPVAIVECEDDELAELRAKINIVEIISCYTDLRQGLDHWEGICPLCKTGDMIVNEGVKMYYCYDCERGGSAIGFIMEKDGVSFDEAVIMVAGMCVMASITSEAVS